MAPVTGSAGDALRAMAEMFSTGDVSSVDDVVATDYVDHQGLVGNEVRGRAGFAEVVKAAREAYTELTVEVVDIELTGDIVEGRLRWVGVLHDGMAAQRETIETIRVDGGRAVEHWGRRLAP